MRRAGNSSHQIHQQGGRDSGVDVVFRRIVRVKEKDRGQSFRNVHTEGQTEESVHEWGLWSEEVLV